MTILEALAILEAAVLECQKRSVDTPEVRAALDLLEPYIQPQWVIPQFRSYLHRDPNVEVDGEATTSAPRDFPQYPRLGQKPTRKANGRPGA